MYYFKDLTNISQFQKKINKDSFEELSNPLVAFLDYTIKDDTLRIDWIQNKEQNKKHGASLMTEFIKTKNKNFKKIYGILSISQIQIWSKSIPFYSDLPKYIKTETHLTYEFHLYDDRKFTKDITPDLKTKSDFLDKFILKHKHSNLDASFSLELIT